ncbi:MAG: hypothetical protein IKO51_07085 [Clostridia bacterium]|nr:hypothetical protein [Clostridia bacterium]
MAPFASGIGGSAENPGKAKFSYRKYYPIRKLIFSTFKEKYNSDMSLQPVMAALLAGDTQPAVVFSTDPLLVACYSDEMDAVVMLEFPKQLAEKYALVNGSRLVASCVYKSDAFGSHASDITLGERYLGNYSDFFPIVQLFIAKNDKKIQKRTELFSEEQWERVQTLAAEYHATHADIKRDGFFYLK